MSYVLDTTTTDTYQYLQCPGSRSVTVQVSNAAAAIGFGRYDGRVGATGTAGYPPADEPLLPVVGGLDRDCDEIRVKSYKTGTPANVKISAR